MDSQNDDLAGLRKRFPEFTDQQLKEVVENLERYFELALRVLEEDAHTSE